jgi:ferritin
LAAAKITPEELKQVLQTHYPANKSTGLSNMPMQCVKWINDKALPTIADFLNKSAIEEMAPE